MVDINLLSKLCEIPGAPGFEYPIRDFVKTQISSLVDELHEDAMGNLIAYIKGDKPQKVMVTAHMDEIGFIVTHIDDDGFLRFHTLGGFDAKTLTAQRVIIHGKKDIMGVMGAKPIHLMKPEERNKAPQISDYYIDCGLSKSEIEKHISIGDPITRERSLIEMGDCVNSKSLDNRVSVYILIEVLKSLQGQKLPYDLFAVFTVQEEIGLRGALTSTHQINPLYGINIDTTIAFDVPGAQSHEQITKLGKGAGIKIMDSSVVCDHRMVRFMKAIADKHFIDWQPEILTAGGTDTANVQRGGKNGSIAGAVSIPTRHIHQAIEMVHKSDIRSAIALVKHCILELDTF